MRLVALALFAGLVGGCITKAKDGSTVVDLRGCRSEAKPVAAPALRDEPPTLEVAKTKSAIVSAVAWGVHEQEAVNVVFSTAPLRCDDVELASDGGTTIRNHPGDVGHLRLAPVMIDGEKDQHGFPHSVVPTSETWRVVEISAPLSYSGPGKPPAFFSTFTASASDPARGATAKGKRTKVRVVVEAGGDRLAGTLALEGCGELAYTREPRPQPALDFRIGDRRVAVRGAVYREVERRDGVHDRVLRLTSAPSDCTGSDPGDVDVEIGTRTVVTMGGLFGTAYNYDGHGLQVRPLGDEAGTTKLAASGLLRREQTADLDPRGDLERREYDRNFRLDGTVDALSCPPIKR